MKNFTVRMSILQKPASKGGRGSGNKMYAYLFHMLGISEHADFHLWSGNMWQFHRAAEALILLRIIILEPNLELNCLCEVAILFFRLGGHLADGLPENITLKLTVTPRSRSYNTQALKKRFPLSLLQPQHPQTIRTTSEKWKELLT
jgi:hypothetical protein